MYAGMNRKLPLAILHFLVASKLPPKKLKFGTEQNMINLFIIPIKKKGLFPCPPTLKQLFLSFPDNGCPKYNRTKSTTENMDLQREIVLIKRSLVSSTCHWLWQTIKYRSCNCCSGKGLKIRLQIPFRCSPDGGRRRRTIFLVLQT